MRIDLAFASADIAWVGSIRASWVSQSEFMSDVSAGLPSWVVEQVASHHSTNARPGSLVGDVAGRYRAREWDPGAAVLGHTKVAAEEELYIIVVVAQRDVSIVPGEDAMDCLGSGDAPIRKHNTSDGPARRGGLLGTSSRGWWRRP